jgi:hypothetical protein
LPSFAWRDSLDFHSVPYYGEHPVIERHYVSARSRRQPRVLVFLAHDAEARAFCYSNADLRKGEEARARTNGIVAIKACAHKLARASYYVQRDQVAFDMTKAFG